MLSMNVRQLYRDKAIKGVRIPVTIWFSVWGLWNVAYYSMVYQPISHYAGMFAAAMNLTWLSMAVYYTRKNSAVLGS